MAVRQNVPQIGTAPILTPEGFMIAPPAQNIVNDPATILGLSPDQFAVVAGGLAAALAPDTGAGRVGMLASDLSKGRITSEALGAEVDTPALAATKTAKKVKPKKSALTSDLEKDVSTKKTLDLSGTLLGG